MNIIYQIIKCLFTPTYSNIDAILTWQYHNIIFNLISTYIPSLGLIGQKMAKLESNTNFTPILRPFMPILLQYSHGSIIVSLLIQTYTVIPNLSSGGQPIANLGL